MQKIQTFIWYNDQAEEAAKLYTSQIKNSKIISTMLGEGGKPMGVTVELDGREIILFNGGPHFQPTDSISFTVYCASEQEIDSLWKAFSDGGKVMLELAEYPWAKKYSWVEDKFGVNWQLTFSEERKPVTPSFLFNGKQQGKAEEAINFWTSQFPNSKINFLSRYEAGEQGPLGQLKFGSFTLEGLDFIAMDSGHPMDEPFSWGISMFVNCDTQQEVDAFWDGLAEGGTHERCGWLKDKFGVSWQIIPNALMKLRSDKDPEKANRVIQAMLGMNKIVIADLEAAYKGEAVEAV
jgi:predicted 3-demethylubiquinone-9 3-methyltransferase (glyoxalase superfamily)